MAREIVWTDRAQKERKEILKYWIERNRSFNYSLKLDALFRDAVKLINEYPNIGKPTDIENVRVKIIREYLMFYQVADKVIYILTLWDGRQDPESLEL